jgi:Protein of unknown function (DUF2874).
MKRKTLFLLTALLAMSFVSCENEANWDIVPQSVHAAFWEKYPNAKRVEWENKGNYKVADFIHDNMEKEAWFHYDGGWHMTETDIPYGRLPQAVKDAFQASEYAAWRIDDIDMIEKNGEETIYIIEVESMNRDVDLYYNENGELV